MSQDRTVIVTGAGSPRGIGREACLRLAAAGWSVAALDLDEGAAQETAALVADANGGQGHGRGRGGNKRQQGGWGGSGGRGAPPPPRGAPHNTRPNRPAPLPSHHWGG